MRSPHSDWNHVEAEREPDNDDMGMRSKHGSARGGTDVGNGPSDVGGANL